MYNDQYPVTCTDLSLQLMMNYLVLTLDKPSSTQHKCVLSSPTSTMQAVLKPAPYVAHTDS